MKDRLSTILTLVFVLLLGGRFETARGEGCAPAAGHASSSRIHAPSKHLDDADNPLPLLLDDDAIGALTERDDDETLPSDGRDLWTDDFFYRPITLALKCPTARSRRAASRTLDNPSPLRC